MAKGSIGIAGLFLLAGFPLVVGFFEMEPGNSAKPRKNPVIAAVGKPERDILITVLPAKADGGTLTIRQCPDPIGVKPLLPVDETTVPETTETQETVDANGIIEIPLTGSYPETVPDTADTEPGDTGMIAIDGGIAADGAKAAVAMPMVIADNESGV